jgi:peptidoglycan/xylan/chitin deacetylase (PgdA/CDA1 family)
MKYNLNKLLKSKLTILLYHGVTSKMNNGIINFQGKHINHNEFNLQMEFVKKYCTPISIDEWIDIKTYNKAIPEYPTIISFDDGFKNNITEAAPILNSLSIPCVFYISTGLIDTNKMFWVDKIEQCINYTKSKSITILLDKRKDYELSSISQKVSALLEIKNWCKAVKTSEKDRVINELKLETQVKPNKDLHDNYKTLSWVDLKEMNNNKLFTIGGHSVNHNILSLINSKDLEFQISSCINKLSSELETKIEHFSYPEGQIHHFNSEVIEVLKKNGIKCCPTAIHGYNDFSEDLFNLKRVMVGFEKIDFPHISK